LVHQLTKFSTTGKGCGGEREGQGRWSGEADSGMQVRRWVAMHTAFHGDLNKFHFSQAHNSKLTTDIVHQFTRQNE